MSSVPPHAAAWHGQRQLPLDPPAPCCRDNMQGDSHDEHQNAHHRHSPADKPGRNTADVVAEGGRRLRRLATAMYVVAYLFDETQVREGEHGEPGHEEHEANSDQPARSGLGRGYFTKEALPFPDDL